MRLGLIGGGFMGEALVSAVLKANLAAQNEITVSDIAEERRRHLVDTYGVSVTEDAKTAIADADIVVFAVKPQEFEAAAGALSGRLDHKVTVLSIMAGVPTAHVADALRHRAVVRAMPNTPAAIGQAMTVWFAGDPVSAEGREAVQRLLAALGRELAVADEKYVDMATAVNGSGPGFVFLVMEAMIDAAVHIGLRRDMAQALVLQTMLGSVMLAQETGRHPAELRNMVTSPGGTTSAGLQVLEEAGLRAAVIAAVEAAFERAKELGA
jgi:pyrroline-5-carboxylate reductase